MQIQSIPAELAQPLRRAVLRPGLSQPILVYPQDADPGAFHAGAFLNGELAGVASIYPEDLPLKSKAAVPEWGQSHAPNCATDRTLSLADADVRRRRRPPAPIAGGRRRPAAWRLRGVAVAEKSRGRGLGRAVVEACLAHARASGGDLVWCYGRTAVLPFYARLGFSTLGEQFDIPISGPHYVMLRRLERSDPVGGGDGGEISGTGG